MRVVVVVDIGQEQLDDDARGGVDGDPGDGVLARDRGGDFAEVFRAGDELMGRLEFFSFLLFLLEGEGRLTLGSHSCFDQTPFFSTGPPSCPTRQMAEETPWLVAASSSILSATYFDSA